MAESVNINGFIGMNDTSNKMAFLSKGRVQPSAILNANVGLQGDLIKREGQTLRVTLAGAHSLWSGNACMLVVAEGTLYKIVDHVAMSIGSISGPKSHVSYIENDEQIYISNKYWNGAYNHVTGVLSSWGVALPPGPALLATSGELPAGVYNVCMTNLSGQELSGNGEINSITLYSPGGIQILNRPSGAIVWCTDCNEGLFYRVGPVDVVTRISTIEPLPSLLCSPPPFMVNLCQAFGLIWGSVSNTVYYSLPFQPSWFRLNTDHFIFDTDVVMIAKVPTGIFIGTLEQTYFLAGSEPTKMVQSLVGVGSIGGTLAYCNNVPALNDVLQTTEKGHQDVPIWRTKDGIVIGNAAGKLYNISKNKLMMDVPSFGASLYRNIDGSFQFLTSAVKKSDTGLNLDTLNLFKTGAISKHEFTHKGMGTTASFSDTATCTVTRGGIEI